MMAKQKQMVNEADSSERGKANACGHLAGRFVEKTTSNMLTHIVSDVVKTSASIKCEHKFTGYQRCWSDSRSECSSCDQ